MAITLKNKLFLEHYKTCKNGSEAARLAGFSPKSASRTAVRLLQIPLIKQEITRWEQEELEKPRKLRESISREVYEKTAWERSEELRAAKKSELAFKYFELYGKARGYVQSEDAQKSDVPLIHLIAKELKLVLPGREIPEKAPSTTTNSGIISDGENVGLDTLPSPSYRTLDGTNPSGPADGGQIDTPSPSTDQQTEIEAQTVENPGAAGPTDTTPGRGLVISVNPLAESPQIFEPINENQKEANG